ncbi:MAG: outer membrane beta-barrel protein [Muribaculaceae bacterium]|nr:outer membrane beta-barrel protein [Muribaculaceae bacterium]
MIRRILLLLAIALSMTIPAAAYTVKGKVLDENSDPMLQASVRVLTPDSTLVKGVLTDINGAYSISGLKAGNYIVETSFVGYDNSSRNIRITNTDITLQPVTMQTGALMLGEATVVGVRTPVKVMQDTVEYNADAYRTQPNAVVEDLLKRLPGVEVDSEGKITANGKSVTKILIDGKEFFADDPTVASRNLPVEMVDKLQVVDRKSDLARITGVDDGEEETVINLTVKKGMNNGWFGNAEAGYGTDDRYKGNFIVNRFWNGNQLTLLGNFNNVNELGFNDGMSGRFRRFGGDNGITKSQALGLNFNIGKDEIFRVGGNLMYSHTDRDTRTSSARTYIFPDSSSYYDTDKSARDRGHTVRADFRVQWQPDSFNTFEFRPNFSYSRNDSWSLSDALTRNGALAEVTRSRNEQSSLGDNYEFRGQLIYNHKVRSKPGRSISFFANYSLSDTREKTDNYSWNKFFLLGDSIDIMDQWSDNHTWSNNISARVSWTEPLGNVRNGNFLTVAYRFQYRWNNADKLTYDHPVLWPDGFAGEPLIGEDLILNEDLTNRFRNDYMSQDIRAGFKHVSKTGSIDVGLSLVPQSSKSIYLYSDGEVNHDKSIPVRNVLNVAPYLRYRYKMGKSRSLNVDYMGRSSQPTMAQLQPVADMSDPLRIVVGNPDLNPSFSHNVRLRFQDFNAEAQRSIMTMVDGQLVQNSIVSKTTYDDLTGGQTTTYENVGGVWNIRGMNMLSMPLRNRQFMFSNFLMANYATAVSFNNGERNRSGSLMLREQPGLSWRPDNLELELRPFYSLQTVHYSLPTTAGRTVHSYGGNFRGTYNAPFGLSVGTDVEYSATSGYSQGFDSKQWMWNATLSYSFLRGRAMTVSLKAYDLLQQKSNVQRTVNANYSEDIRYNSLTRYFMVTVAYKFNTFGSGRQPESRNDFRHGPGGPGGPPPGGRPM